MNVNKYLRPAFEEWWASFSINSAMARAGVAMSYQMRVACWRAWVGALDAAALADLDAEEGRE